MSCHLSHRLTTVHRSVSMALLYSVGYAALMSNAQAATIGKTVITSAQHEPLAASIMVTDIKTADFSASLANSSIYQQMGLTPTDSMTVRFQPTSATSGQVFITTTKPISQPFADVVLAINDGTQRNVIPKTLLMPLKDSLPITPTSSNVRAANKPNLPIVSTTNAQPLTVRKGAPPPLLLASKASSVDLSASKATATRLPASSIQLPSSQTLNLQTANIQVPKTLSSLSTASTMTLINTTPSTANRLNNTADINKNVAIQANTTNASTTSALDNTKTAPINEHAFDILNIKITRQIQLKNNDISNNTIMVNKPMAPMLYKDASTAKISSDSTTVDSNPLGKTSSSEAPYSNSSSNQAASSQSIASNTFSISANASIVENTTANTSDNSSDINYTVQRNDNLWLIAQQIADKNNLDVQIVMKEIQTQNPNAFINKNADQLKADAQLRLPRYDVVPSQKKLKAAINEQRKYHAKANTPLVKKTTIAKTESVQAKGTEKPAIKKTQTLPTAQFSVLAPGHDGSADGTKTKAGMETGNGLSTDVLDILKSSRKSTADQAQRLSKTNSTLGSYTKKLQLQNQKLAELQARLEKLRNQ
ncbi:FimV family protein [Psychrobacter immobilis]|uniref:type IV pilus assembly protein FimV n=1 Tax=Psychrobacter immobilis TaxID=498 RepID=UPI00191A8439|nr:peptigoglycan-binding protein LysM [Psychrobacter immobilis]